MANRKDNKYQVSHFYKFLHAKRVLEVNHSIIDIFKLRVSYELSKKLEHI